MRSPWRLLASALPALGLAVLVVRAEIRAADGPMWRIDIEGFDPRDLLHGHYLQYRYAFRRGGPDTCGAVDPENLALDPGCCLCLERRDGAYPDVRQTSCEEARACDGYLRSEAVLPPQRWFAPEDRAQELEDALRGRAAALELRSGPDGTPAILQLLLDDRPWREVLGRPAPSRRGP